MSEIFKTWVKKETGVLRVGAVLFSSAFLGWLVGAFILSSFPKTASASTQTFLTMPIEVLGTSTSTGNSAVYPTGSLIRDQGAIYFINKTTKIPFADSQVFTGLGYSLANVKDGDLSAYTAAVSYRINSANMAHPWGTWLINKGTVYYASQDGLIGAASPQVFTANGGNWAFIVKANQFDLAILKAKPNLPGLENQDGRIITNAVLPDNNGLTPKLDIALNSNGTLLGSAGKYFSANFVAQNYLKNSSGMAEIRVTASGTLPSGLAFVSNNGCSNLASTTACDPLPFVDNIDLKGTPTQAGTFQVTLTANDGLAAKFAEKTFFVVIGQASIAGQSLSSPNITAPSSLKVNVPGNFSVSASDPGNNPLTYTFSWGDGAVSIGVSSSSASHAFTTAGTYVVTVVADNSHGQTSINSAVVNVTK